jgi:predicted Zn-dependent protease
VEILELLVTHYIATGSKEAEKHLKLLLSRSKNDSQTLTLLRMANYYLENKQAANSRACILKYLQKKPANSGYSWRILGKSFIIKESANYN